MSKTRVADLLGEKALVLPELLNAAIIANERCKYILGLLQLAASNADRSDPQTAPSLRAERETCGIAEANLDRVVARSEALGPGSYYIPEAAHLVVLLGEALDAMLSPLALAGIDDHESLAARKSRLMAAIPSLDGDIVTGDTIAALSSGRPEAGDGVHVLVMDLHKELNRLQAAIAEDTVAGAAAYGITAQDRPLIEAFMAGVARTAPLKFDHPGLGTTATRAGDTLLIQNDIGATEAHVIMIRVDGLAVHLTYTDVHLPRLRFFQTMLASAGIDWEGVNSRQVPNLADSDLFYLTIGEFVAADEAALHDFLDRLGSRIVFLIDWNKARKRLGQLVPNALAVELLVAAAENDIGHRAFLQLGGERLVYDALEQAVRTPLRYGEPLHEMLGIEDARDYLGFVLKTAATGLRDGHSEMAIRDRVRAELFSHFRSAEQRLLAEAARHAAILVKIAHGLHNALRRGEAPGGEGFLDNARRAKELESSADEIVRKVRSTVQRIGGGQIFQRMVEIADDAADELEDAAFLGGIKVGNEDRPPATAPLTQLAELMVTGADCYERAITAAPLLHHGAREPVENFVAAVEGLVTVEHRTDAIERDVLVALMAAPIEPRLFFLFRTIAQHIETAADALARAGLTLRDHVFGDTLLE
ncbi:MAG TPA: DUF47 family protein [Stellaceae bacterium]|nr:DUF47 family protein [Stellaceae bacterium]